MADQLPPEKDESLIDMATRYGQGVGPGLLAKAPTVAKEAFSWGKRILGKVDLPKATAPKKAPTRPVRKASGGLSRVNESGNYTKPGMRKRLFNSIKARAVQGTGAGQWSARKAQLLAKSYKEKGGGYKD